MVGTATRVGVYVDSVNIAMNGGRGMRYDVLREFACRDGGEAMRLNAYVVYDPERARGLRIPQPPATVRVGAWRLRLQGDSQGGALVSGRARWSRR